ncbi:MULTISPECIES: DUF4932 domain-containing protein [Halanaerobium]|jgi:hypothetical protein|uniref:DUF4932 domain-containing protein n=1 Tax=Halanaerobium kushneri TaxID=56779 RepID=A0A1N7A9H8_9FIRM|nr:MULTISPECIES: DUF4932 domain-containing protein [Halanaerobium]RCW54617.1 uncharacterized protein DUF4932 [Halanaerobium sp. ST460_2HS_T2]SIR35708.1 protein of unknown function [Halanaerobium kushneri]
MCFKIKGKWFWIVALFVISLIILLLWQPWKYTYSTSDLKTVSIISGIEIKKEHIEQNRGKLRIEIPKTYELLHIIISLGEYGQSSGMIYKDTEYYQEVQRYFKEYKQHPIVKKLSDSLTKSRGNYNKWKNYSAYYNFEGEKLIANSNYPFYSDNNFSMNLNLFLDFAEKSKFLAFYKNHQDYYQNQINQFEKKSMIKQIWSWLEMNFLVEYDSHRIVFSPLAGSTPHNTFAFKAKNYDYQETFIFVQGLDSYSQSFNGKLSKDEQRGLFISNLFTEIDHNYVNPATNNYLSDIAPAFSNFKKWNQQQGYSSIPMTFNEYMTWATFIVFAAENFEEKLFEKTRNIQELIMIQGRQFKEYREFNQRLLQLYQNKKNDEKLVDLYPEIINWAAENNKDFFDLSALIKN